MTADVDARERSTTPWFVLATVVLVQGIVQRDGVRTANEVFGVVVILASLAYLLGVLSALSAVRGAAADPSGEDGEIVRGETLEWALPTPAHGDRIPDDLPAVESPYPLAADDTTTEVAR